MSEQKTRTEEFQVQGEEILAKVKELVRQGNIRRISIKSEDGKPIVDIPLTLGVVARINLQALRLLAKRVPFFHKPAQMAEETP